MDEFFGSCIDRDRPGAAGGATAACRGHSRYVTPEPFSAVAGSDALSKQNSDNAYVFRVDPGTGKLTATDWKIEVGSPSCFVFTPVK